MQLCKHILEDVCGLNTKMKNIYSDIQIQIIILQVAGTQSYKRQNALSKAGCIAEEMLSSIRTVVAFGGQKKGIERFAYVHELSILY